MFFCIDFLDFAVLKLNCLKSFQIVGIILELPKDALVFFNLQDFLLPLDFRSVDIFRSS